MSLRVIGARGGLKKVVIASLAGLPLSAAVLGSPWPHSPWPHSPWPSSAFAADPATPPAAEAPAAEPPAVEAPPAEAPAADAPVVEAPPTDPSPTQPPPAEAPTSEAPPETTPVPPAAEPVAVEEEAPWVPPRDSIFDAGYGRRGGVAVAIGGLVDATDPRAAAGASLRVPQFTSDARFGLGKGVSVTLHLNTILAINELDAGASWSFPMLGGALRGLVQFQAGAFVGMLGGFGFQSLVIAPQFRPLVGVSLPVGNMRWSLRGEVLFSGPYSATLGDVTNTLATMPPIASWNVALMLENLMKNNHLWYAGLVMMASTATYQNWLLFPDTSYYDYYPRVLGGYEF